MKNKKTVLYLTLSLLLAILVSSCAIDRKCPAYTQAGGSSVSVRA